MILLQINISENLLLIANQAVYCQESHSKEHVLIYLLKTRECCLVC